MKLMIILWWKNHLIKLSFDTFYYTKVIDSFTYFNTSFQKCCWTPLIGLYYVCIKNYVNNTFMFMVVFFCHTIPVYKYNI